MAKKGRTLPARRQRPQPGEESVLIESAERLGRMIGTLQRQMDRARTLLTREGRFESFIPGRDGHSGDGNGSGAGRTANLAAKKKAKKAAAQPSARTKAPSTAARARAGTRKTASPRRRKDS